MKPTFYSISLLTLLILISNPFKSEMAPVGNNLYFDKGEVSNENWKIFEQALTAKGINTLEYRRNDVWKIDAFKSTYFSHPAYQNYPVVGVTKFGAVEYCKWRNTQTTIDGTFRLPTKQEFLNTIEEGENSKRLQKKKLKFSAKGYQLYNFNNDPESNHMMSPAQSMLKNKYGIYNLIGNVSEMVVENDIVVGGSWRDIDDKKWHKVTQESKIPADWIGFRCVCEMN